MANFYSDQSWEQATDQWHFSTIARAFPTYDWLKIEDVKTQALGIDCVFILDDGKDGFYEVLAEFKSDRNGYRSRNMFFETVVNTIYGPKPGWAHYCQADVLSYILFNGKKPVIQYILDWHKAQAKFRSTALGFKSVKGPVNSNGSYGVGRLVPPEALEGCFIKVNEDLI